LVLLAVLVVPPVDPVAQRAEVILGAASAHGEQARAKLSQPWPGLLGRAEAAVHADRALDLRRVAADVGAVLGEDRRLALELVEVGEGVPDVGVLGDQSQRLADAAAADQDRDGPGRRRVEPPEALLYPRQGLRQVGEPAARRAELVAIFVVVPLEPANRSRGSAGRR
jgi:hypothetical protein